MPGTRWCRPPAIATGLLAFALAGARGFSLAASFVALWAFLGGAGASGRLVVHVGAERRGRMLAVASACEVVLVATALVVGWTATPLGSGPPRYVLIILLGVAAGVQNGTARKLAVPDLTTTVLTSTLAGAAFDSRAGGGSGSRVGRRGLAAAAMFVGALVGAFCVIHVGKPVGLLVALFLLVPVVAVAATLSSKRPAWEHVA